MTSNDFDERAATWDDPQKAERARAIAAAIGDSVPLNQDMRVLEYGAGTGLLSEALAGQVGQLTLADPSAGMRDVLAGKIAAGTLPGSSRVWDIDLATAETPDESFDLIVSMMALHHIPDVPAVFAGCARLLPAGGFLCVSDLVAEDGSFHSSDFEGHHGFDTDELSQWLCDAEFDQVTVRHAFDITREDRNYPLFLAAATRAEH